MENLSPQNRELILSYYASDSGALMEARKNLAGRLGLGANALAIRAHRIRESLRRCVSACFNREGSKLAMTTRNGHRRSHKGFS